MEIQHAEVLGDEVEKMKYENKEYQRLNSFD
jgi:hypothetical protein